MGISRTGTGAIVDCVVSIGLILGQNWTEGYQDVWYWVGIGLRRINKTSTGQVAYCYV